LRVSTHLAGELRPQDSGARLQWDAERLDRQLEVTDRRIDQLVCELHGLTDEEIQIVEAATWRE
jgi:plasmid maintenance system antidote protein VapI